MTIKDHIYRPSMDPDDQGDCAVCGMSQSAHSRPQPPRPKLPLTLRFQGIGLCFYRLGSFRCPDRGDFFVSGAEPFCYRASQHLTAEYWIATPTRKAVQRTIWVPGDVVKVPDLAPTVTPDPWKDA